MTLTSPDALDPVFRPTYCTFRFTGLLVATVVGGLGGGPYALVGACFAAVADLTIGLPPGKRTLIFGVTEACLWIGLVVGPFLGAVVASVFGLKNTFFFVAGPATLALIIVVLMWKESNPPERRSKFRWGRANPIGALYMLTTNKVLRVPTASLALVLAYMGVARACV